MFTLQILEKTAGEGVIVNDKRGMPFISNPLLDPTFKKDHFNITSDEICNLSASVVIAYCVEWTSFIILEKSQSVWCWH